MSGAATFAVIEKQQNNNVHHMPIKTEEVYSARYLRSNAHGD